MKDFIQKINNLGTWYKPEKGHALSYEREGIRPAKDWDTMLTTASVVLLILAGAAYYFYVRVEGGIFALSSETIQNEAKINNALFKKTVDDINNRKTARENLNRNLKIPADPSLY